MLGYGHDVGRREDYAFAFLLGHSSYYPRHGYQTNTHGLCKVEIDAKKLPEASVKLDARPVQSADVPCLLERLEAELADVHFGWLRGTTLEEWRWSGIDSLVWCDGDGRRVAGGRYDASGETVRQARDVVGRKSTDGVRDDL